MIAEATQQITPQQVLYGIIFGVLLFVSFLERQHRRNKRRRQYRGQGPRRVPQHMRMQVWRRDGPNCYLCGGRYGKVHLHCRHRHLLFFTIRDHCDLRYQADHVIPYSRGGITHPSNLRVTHARCNRAKSDKVIARRR